MIRRALFIAAFILMSARPVMADPVEVDATGTGTTREEAVAQALASAVAQVSGVSISAMQASSMKLAAQASDDSMTVTLSKDSQTDIQTAAGGWIRSYRIEDVRQIGNGRLEASVRVTVESFKARTAGADSRRRIAVSVTGDSVSGSQAALLRDKIVAGLVQTRRFAVVDRSNDTAYRAEMNLLQGGDAPLTERVRIGQVLGADYVLIAKMRVTAGTRSETRIPATGEIVVNSTPGSMNVDFQVIEIATRQVAWAGATQSGGTDKAAEAITGDITRAIYPMRLIRFDDPSSLIINQGGSGLRPGQRFVAFRLSDDLEDPDTHESLGKVETQVGVVEVTRVDTKVSYAKLVNGKLPASADGPAPQIVLRGVPAAQVSQQSTGSGSRRVSKQDDIQTGVKLPFDK